MNKKMMLLLGLFLVVGTLLVLGDDLSESNDAEVLSPAERLSPAAQTQYDIDCQGDDDPCTITGENSYRRDLGDGNIETVTVRDNDIIIRESTATNRVSITPNEIDYFRMTSEQFNLLGFRDAEPLNVLSSYRVEYTIGDSARTATNTGGILVVREGDEVLEYLIGNEPVTRDGDQWVFRGERYSSLESTENEIRLGTGNEQITVTSVDGNVQIRERSGDGYLVTTQLSDGRVEETQAANGQTLSRTRYDANGRRAWEDQNFANGNPQNRAFYFPDGRLYGWCSYGGTQACVNPTVEFDWRSGCQYDETACYTASPPQEFQDAIYDDQLWRGGVSTLPLDIGRALFGHPISFYTLANSWEGYKEWIQDVDKAFASAYLGEDYLVSAWCEVDWPLAAGAPNAINLIRTPQDTFQSAGHIVAERVPVGPLLCDDDRNCPASLECREDQFCYGEGAGEPTTGYLYKIDWGVTAPRNEELVGARGAGQTIKFNLVAYTDSGREVFLFAAGTGRPSRNTITLETGENSASTYAPLIAEYSPEKFTRVCIEWSEDEDFVPQTLSTDFGGGTDPLSNLCDDITETQPGRTLESATDPTGVSQSRTIRYCALSGCR
ncbi:hypothetical protein HYS49_01285 [Candidatus Woesearchaeota archaeon]|nr:hypothetical protein [Candidatus Woesearchaeota archaeon]